MRALKWIFDRLAGLLGLILLGPLMLVLAVMIRAKLGSPVLFVQERPGKDCKVFKMIKFRTMRDARDADGNPLPDDQRMTPFGDFLRKSSLDELPELINVVKGDMSLVGPRPLLVQYLERYTPEQNRRHDVKPGLTGLAQVSGRNALSWEDKFRLDLEYIDNWSPVLDLKIMLLTVEKVFKRSDISAADSSTMPEFMGSSAAASKSKVEPVHGK